MHRDPEFAPVASVPDGSQATVSYRISLVIQDRALHAEAHEISLESV